MKNITVGKKCFVHTEDVKYEIIELKIKSIQLNDVCVESVEYDAVLESINDPNPIKNLEVSINDISLIED